MPKIITNEKLRKSQMNVSLPMYQINWLYDLADKKELSVNKTLEQILDMMMMQEQIDMEEQGE